MSKLEQLKSLLKATRDVAAAAEAEGRDLTTDERTLIETNLAKASTLKADVKLGEALAGFDADISAVDRPTPGATIDGAVGRHRPGKTIGEAFVDDPGFKQYLKTIAPAGSVGEKARVQSPPLGFAGLKALGLRRGGKALVTGASATSAGALVDADFLGLVDADPYARPLTLLDAITNGDTGSDTVEYVRVNTVTNAAAPVAEATAVAGGSGEKPESAITFERVSTPVRTLAHWIPATKRALSDAGQVRTLIDSFLRYGLLEELEDQIISGNGIGENFEGLLNISGVQVQTWDTDLLTTTRKAKTKVRTIGRAAANAYAFHPNDAERLDLLKDDQGRFYFGGPADDGVQRLWRLPVVETEAIPEGTGVVGDWRRAILWDREQAAVSVSDSHSDFFIRNLVAILGELRAAFGVTRPAAFCTFGVTEGASS